MRVYEYTLTRPADRTNGVHAPSRFFRLRDETRNEGAASRGNDHATRVSFLRTPIADRRSKVKFVRGIDLVKGPCSTRNANDISVCTVLGQTRLFDESGVREFPVRECSRERQGKTESNVNERTTREAVPKSTCKVSHNFPIKTFTIAGYLPLTVTPTRKQLFHH